MTEWSGLGKFLIGSGIVLIVIGGLLILSHRLTGWPSGLDWLGSLPGDLSIKRDNFSVYFPLATSLIISVVLSVILYVWSFLVKR